MIGLQGATRAYGATRAVRGVDLQVAEGELVALVGPSGCGKTTTLRLINRLVEHDGGSVTVDGRAVEAIEGTVLRRMVGMVFQRFALFPHFTVAENIGITPRLLGWERAAIDGRVEELLTMVGLDPPVYAARMPAMLSGGQQQRVGLARALAARPQVLLLDEPFAALDPVNRDSMQRELRRIHESLRLATLLVTHDMGEALLLADRIAVMEAGAVIRAGTPAEVVAAPGHPLVEQLLSAPRRQQERLSALIGGRLVEGAP
ncbi:MAG: ABC transporter ATP-binding protein [Deltaproteobacteria bacterium]|nr:ABC transporter ATP-binding protein [Deltaproteobacteria bacterium]